MACFKTIKLKSNLFVKNKQNKKNMQDCTHNPFLSNSKMKGFFFLSLTKEKLARQIPVFKQLNKEKY